MFLVAHALSLSDRTIVDAGAGSEVAARLPTDVRSRQDGTDVAKIEPSATGTRATSETGSDAKTDSDAEITAFRETAAILETKAADGTKPGETAVAETAAFRETKAANDTRPGETAVAEKQPEVSKAVKPKKKLVLDIDMPGTRLDGRMSWDQATEYCDARTVGNIKTWRLPKAAELLKFKGNTKLENRKFWTSEFMAGRVKVINFPNGIVEEASSNMAVGYVVCVALM